MTDEVPATAAAPRRRAGRGSGTVRVAPSTVKYRSLKHRFPATPVVSEDELEAIHDASLTILEEMGMDFMHVEAREILKKAGADVRPGSERVRFDRNLILQAIKTCPSEFTLHARNPERNIRIGGKNLAFAQVASHPIARTCRAAGAPATSRISATCSRWRSAMTWCTARVAIR